MLTLDRLHSRPTIIIIIIAILIVIIGAFNILKIFFLICVIKRAVKIARIILFWIKLLKAEVQLIYRVAWYLELDTELK